MDKMIKIEAELREQIRTLKKENWNLRVELRETKGALDSLDPTTMTLKS